MIGLTGPFATDAQIILFVVIILGAIAAGVSLLVGMFFGIKALVKMFQK